MADSSSSSSIDSSSSSSIDSSSSSSSIDSSSSSSSSGDFVNRDIQNGIVINASYSNIIPFTFIGEKGTDADLGDNTKIAFTIEGSSSTYFDYNAVINRDSSALLSTEETTVTVYVPEDEKAKYKHEESFYVDIIAKDVTGIKSIRTHVDTSEYEFEDITEQDETFYIPKFTWEQ